MTTRHKRERRAIINQRREAMGANNNRIQVPGQVQIKAQYTPTDAAFPISMNAGNGSELVALVFGGLSKREYAAVQIAGAMAGRIFALPVGDSPSAEEQKWHDDTVRQTGREAIALADAVLAAAREPQQPQPEEQPNGI
jgi:hypothetical protein